MHHTDDTSIDNVTTEADENDFSDLSDEALGVVPLCVEIGEAGIAG